jgi:hypothetical protein
MESIKPKKTPLLKKRKTLNNGKQPTHTLALKSSLEGDDINYFDVIFFKLVYN